MKRTDGGVWDIIELQLVKENENSCRKPHLLPKTPTDDDEGY